MLVDLILDPFAEEHVPTADKADHPVLATTVQHGYARIYFGLFAMSLLSHRQCPFAPWVWLLTTTSFETRYLSVVMFEYHPDLRMRRMKRQLDLKSCHNLF